MNTLLLHVDAFTDHAFAGNPAAVCLLPPSSTDAWKQSLAAEMNLSETAFVEPAAAPDSSSGNIFNLRWLTPKAEVPLCGHATLASAHALWEEGIVPSTQEIGFDTLSGRLRARRSPDGITLDFPAIIAAPAPVPPALQAVLGATVVAYGESKTKLLAELANEAAVAALTPDFTALLALPKEGVIVTARADASQQSTPQADFVSRFFAPRIGVPEDPVTGSSHAVLAPWWSAKLGKTNFFARQLSARGGAMHLRLDGDRLFLTGKAVTITRGTLSIAPK
jgi:PhzF family phenazine biosynthesis protein